MAEIARVSSKGQVTLPVTIRRRLGLKKGSKIVFLEAGDEVRILSEEQLERRFEVFDRRREELGLTPEDLRVLVKEARDRLWREYHAGGR